MQAIIDQLMDEGCPFRLERKYVVQTFLMSEVILQLKTHPAAFNEIHHKRTVNNIYFDTPNQDAYWANLHGNDERIKVRVRWYGQTFGCIDHPVLELKIKRGICNYKLNYPLKSFTLDHNWKAEDMQKIFEDADLPRILLENLAMLDVVVLNSYDRSYYQSNDRRYRITLDDQLTFYQLNFWNNVFLAKTKLYEDIIIELKYEVIDDLQASDIALELPFRLSRHSKYVRGMEYVYL